MKTGPALATLALCLLVAAGAVRGGEPQPEPEIESRGPESLPLTASQRRMLAEHPVLRLGAESDWQPIEFFDAEGRYSGILASYMHTLEQRLGIRFELVRKPSWGEVLAAFEKGEVDVLSALGRTAENQETMRFTTPYITLADGLIVRTDEVYAERLSELPAGRRLAAVTGYGSSQRAMAANPNLVMVPVKTTQEALIAVSTGKADVAIASLAAAYHIMYSQGLSNLRLAANYDEAQQQMGLALRPELAGLVPVFNVALASITPGEHEAIRSRWTRVRVDRGFERETVLRWSAVGVTLLLALAGAALWLYSLQRRSRRLANRAEGAEAQFRAVIDSLPALFWMLRVEPGRPWVTTYFSEQALAYAGFDPTHKTLGWEEATQMMSDADRQRLEALMEKHAASMRPLRFEHRVVGPRASASWAYTQAVPRREGKAILWYGCTLDVSERKALESALESSRNQLQELASGVPGALWQFRREPDGRQGYRYMSEGITGITGRTPEETDRLMQDRSFISVHPDDQPILQGLMQRLTEKPGIDEARYRLRTVSGEWKWVQVAARAMPVGADGALVWNGVTLDATRMHDTEEALRLEQQRFQELADNLAGAIWRMHRSADGRYVFDYISEGVQKLTGRTAEEILADEEHHIDRIVPGDRERAVSLLEASAQTGEPFEAEYSLRSADGKTVRLYARAAVRIDRDLPVWSGVLLNVSERHRLETELGTIRERMDDIINTFPGAIFQMQRGADGRERFTVMSENIREITGRPASATLNQPGLPFEVMAPEDRERVRALIEESARTLGSAQAEYRLRTASGDYRWVSANFTARRMADGTLAWNGILIDASQQKRLEEELRAASERAHQASLAKSRFLANMSHEIRTPMNAVLGLAHLAMTSEIDPQQQERLAKIHRAGKALLKLLNDILEYSRLDAGKFVAIRAPFDLQEIKQNLRLFATPAAEAKGLSFVIDCPGSVPLHWVGDATRIQQVLLNLITNAIKFTDAGQVLLVVRLMEEQAPDTSGSGLCFEVRDTGIGMSAGELARVFEAFEQASGDTERRYGGTGLGLSICRELVQGLGGTLEVKSAPGEGSTFLVRFPLERVAAAASATAPKAGELPGLAERVSRLAMHIGDRETTAARTALLALRLMLSPSGRQTELYPLEKQLAAFDFDAAGVELARLSALWGLAGPPRP